MLLSQQPDPGFWWQVELKIAVSGEYNYRKNDEGFDGNYSFTTLLLGTLEEDEGDFIFLQAYQGLKEAGWKESYYKENNREEHDLSGKIKPEATLNYVFREKGELSFDFDFQPVPVPYKNPVFPNAVKQLCLPQCAADPSINARKRYGKGIVNGSNRAVLADTAIYNEKEVYRTFNWKWQEKNTSWKSHHEVEVKLKIIRRLKK